MTITIQPVETPDGAFWISLDMDGGELERRGPYADKNEAEATAYRLAAVCRAMRAEVHHVVTPAAAVHEK